MFNTWQALFRLRPVSEELRAELNRMLIQRLRIVVLLALVFVPSFVPLDYLRMRDHFAWAVGVRGTGCVLLLGLVVLLSMDAAERWAEGLAAIGVGVISGTVLGVARFAHGADDPVYLVQAMAIISLVTGAALRQVDPVSRRDPARAADSAFDSLRPAGEPADPGVDADRDRGCHGRRAD